MDSQMLYNSSVVENTQPTSQNDEPPQSRRSGRSQDDAISITSESEDGDSNQNYETCVSNNDKSGGTFPPELCAPPVEHRNVELSNASAVDADIVAIFRATNKIGSREELLLNEEAEPADEAAASQLRKTNGQERSLSLSSASPNGNDAAGAVASGQQEVPVPDHSSMPSSGLSWLRLSPELEAWQESDFEDIIRNTVSSQLSRTAPRNETTLSPDQLVGHASPQLRTDDQQDNTSFHDLASKDGAKMRRVSVAPTAQTIKLKKFGWDRANAIRTALNVMTKGILAFEVNWKL